MVYVRRLQALVRSLTYILKPSSVRHKGRPPEYVRAAGRSYPAGLGGPLQRHQLVVQIDGQRIPRVGQGIRRYVDKAGISLPA